MDGVTGVTTRWRLVCVLCFVRWSFTTTGSVGVLASCYGDWPTTASHHHRIHS